MQDFFLAAPYKYLTGIIHRKAFPAADRGSVWNYHPAMATRPYFQHIILTRLHIIGKHPLFSVHIHHFEVDAGPSFGQLTTLGQLFFQNLTLFFHFDPRSDTFFRKYTFV